MVRPGPSFLTVPSRAIVILKCISPTISFHMPSNFELYKNIHKGQRREMFRISEMAGLAGPEDPEDVKRLNARIASFRDEMHNHAHMEEVHIHPLLGQRVPGGTRKLEEDHVVMHRQLDEILAMADTMLGSSVPPTESKAMFQELYLAWNRFVAFYLQHIETGRGESADGTVEAVQRGGGKGHIRPDPGVRAKGDAGDRCRLDAPGREQRGPRGDGPWPWATLRPRC